MHRTVDGFRFGGVACGIKASGGADLALLVADVEAAAAGVFTRNRVRAAPVVISQRRIRAGWARGVIINSGNANACTGPDGTRAAHEMIAAAAAAVGCPPSRMLVASTGVIGVPLPVGRIVEAMPRLHAATQQSEDGFAAFARAILTTDKGPKIAAVEITVGRTRVRVVGCAKGAGMIAPDMATTLGFVVTDASVAPAVLRALLRDASAATFNEVSVDGDTSTNDSLFLLASGRAGNRRIDTASGRAGRGLGAALREVLEDLATQIVADGEGATRVVTIEVVGARSESIARAVARRVGASPLVKTALFGADPNWGRVLAAAGNAGVPMDPGRVDIDIGEVPVVRGGVGVAGAEARAHAAMDKDRVGIRIDLHQGRAAGRHVTCDLTYDYVRINADYHT